MSLYSTLYRRALWPGYEKLRGRHTHQLLDQAEDRQWRTAAQLRDWQWQELTALLRHARTNSPYYRTLADIQKLEEVNRLPLLTKSIIREHREELLAANYRGRVITHKTGGSTGVPLSFYMDRSSYEWRNAMMLRGYGWAGAHEGVKQFFLWSIAVGGQSKIKQWKTALHDRSMRRAFFNNFKLSKATLPKCLESLNQFAPAVLVGYTSMLEYLARYIKKHGGLRVKLKSVLTAAEGINDAQRELLQEVFGARVYASYGSREFKLIAMECERGGLHLSADNLLVEVLRNGQAAAPGEPGQVIITDLHNFGMPFVRYEIGDVATLREETCPCGRGLPLLGAVHGRVPDTIQTPDGKLISGIFFPHLLKEFDWIEQFQVVQKDFDSVQLKLIVTDQPAAEKSLPQLRREIADVLGQGVRIDVEFVKEIPRTATGKHRPVISEIPVRI